MNTKGPIGDFPIKRNRKTKNQTNMATDYIPATKAGRLAWLTNFSTLITATPAAFGLTAPDAVIIAAQKNAYDAAYTASVDPATRTAVTVATEQTAWATAEAIVRPYAVQISLDAGVTVGNKTAVGVTNRKTDRTPTPPPTDYPVLAALPSVPGQAKFEYRAAGTPTTKAKPPGVIGVETRYSIGTVPAIDADLARSLGTFTRSPFTVTTSPADKTKLMTVIGRFVTRGGPAGEAQAGPWSAPVTVVVS